MTREEISKKITDVVDYLGTLKVEGYKNAKIFVTSLEVLDSLSRETLLEDKNNDNSNQ